MLIISDTIQIPDDELEFSYARSGAPGPKCEQSGLQSICPLATGSKQSDSARLGVK